jgi:hypothetical protein
LRTGDRKPQIDSCVQVIPFGAALRPFELYTNKRRRSEYLPCPYS